MQKLPLEGIRVLDFGIVWHGPHLGQWLGVMGADVIKIETSLRPDSTRQAYVPGKPQPLGLNTSADFTAFN
ncbi:MAG: CoA transferase, partial [Dehalococcoidales bacterium]|nr:CoA transferase [Dehalococcoidales bacterium]